ncbi:MAG: Mur ligase family protein [Candidatus Kerfeldbacteria bacterium]
MEKNKVHIVGIGGCGASGVARYLKALGMEVTGSDSDRARTVGLKTAGIPVEDAHSAGNIGNPDVVLFSPGVFAAARELSTARRKKIPVLTWQEFLGKFLSRRTGDSFMVAGTFGKGSTAAILGHILAAAYLDPLAILGVDDLSWDSNIRIGSGPWLLEADEYDRHFHFFHPSYTVLTSLEHEHVSTYKTFESYVDAFARFFRSMKQPHAVVAKRTPSIDANTKRLFPNGAITYSISDDADVRGTISSESAEGSRFMLHSPKFSVEHREFEIRVPGRIHVENAVGAIALALAAGIDINAANAGLATFRGLKSRYEVVRHGAFTTIFDYAHTPDRIRPVIEHTKKLFPGKRIIVLFEPHLYSRTKQYLGEFTAVLREANRSYVTDIFPSREAKSPLRKKVHAKDLTKDGGDRVLYVGSLENGISTIERNRTERDVVLVLGAGPVQFASRKLTDTIAR